MLPVVVSSPARAASYLFPLIFPKKPKLRTSGCRHLPTPIHFSFFCWFLLPAHHHDLQCDSSFNCEDSSVQRHDSFHSWLLGPWPPLLQESFPLLCPTSASSYAQLCASYSVPPSPACSAHSFFQQSVSPPPLLHRSCPLIRPFCLWRPLIPLHLAWILGSFSSLPCILFLAFVLHHHTH